MPLVVALFQVLLEEKKPRIRGFLLPFFQAYSSTIIPRKDFMQLQLISFFIATLFSTQVLAQTASTSQTHQTSPLASAAVQSTVTTPKAGQNADQVISKKAKKDKKKTAKKTKKSANTEKKVKKKSAKKKKAASKDAAPVNSASSQ